MRKRIGGRDLALFGIVNLNSAGRLNFLEEVCRCREANPTHKDVSNCISWIENGVGMDDLHSLRFNPGQDNVSIKEIICSSGMK